MNLSNQDKAFIITFSGAAFLVLIFFFTTIQPFDDSEVEEFMDIPVIEEEDQEILKEEQEMIAQNEPISHQVKNDALQEEAERFFEQEDEIREALEEELEIKQNENEPTANEKSTSVSEYRKKLKRLRKKIEEKKKAAEQSKEEKPTKRKPTKTKQRTSISYHLADRNAQQIPNPVYTCDGAGKVVINITVNDLGRVIKTSFNRSASTTSNGCLVEQALDYAARALFNSASRKEQLGSITFQFQG